MLIPPTMTRSVSDPDFTYTPSKNIYWEKLMHPPKDLQGIAYADQDTEKFRGHWINHFPAGSVSSSEASSAPEAKPFLHVEVGCNAGHVSLEWAKLNPGARYIGIDWKFKQIYRLAEKAGAAGIKNIMAFRANAERLPLMFGPSEIDYLYLFFPDPWPKKAQMKNRTASLTWLKNVAPLLSPRGYFHIKTDHAHYYEFIRENLEQLKETYEVLEETRNLHAGNAQAHLLKIPLVTLFERLFIKDGLPIHSIKVRRR